MDSGSNAVSDALYCGAAVGKVLGPAPPSGCFALINGIVCGIGHSACLAESTRYDRSSDTVRQARSCTSFKRYGYAKDAPGSDQQYQAAGVFSST